MKRELEPKAFTGSMEGCGSIATCRICFDCEVDQDDDLISPCMCKGSVQFVHRSCLDHWRSVKKGFAFSHCDTCKAQFHFRVNESEESSLHRTRTKSRLFVAKDIFILILALHIVSAMTGLITSMVYLSDIFSPQPNDTFHTNDLCLVCVIGVLGFFELPGLFGIVLVCYSNHNHQRRLRFVRFGVVVNCIVCLCVLYVTSIRDPKIITFGRVRFLSISILMIFSFQYAFIAGALVRHRISQRHSHILPKGSLTQEYVIEDLQGCYTPTKLDPKHEERLKELKLF